MQFLLVAVNARYIHTNPALYSLRAYAGRELDSYVSLAEYTINHRMEEVLGDLYKRHPDVIGLSCYIWNFHFIQELLKEIPKVLPDTDIWLGGPEVSCGTEEILKEYPGIRGIMIGEGEATFKDLLSYYAKKRDHWIGSAYHSLEEIPGLALPEGTTVPREPIEFGEIPFLYDHLEEFENKIIYYETSRGCPFRCAYCLSSIDKRLRFRNEDKVKGELQFFLDHKVFQVKFIDRTFNCNHAHAMGVWKYLKDHDNGVTNFHFEIAADLMTDEELGLLRTMRPGLVQLEIGVQTTNPETLKAVSRNTDISKIERAVSEIRKGKNIHLHLDLIAGLPLEDYESFGKSFDRVYSMRPHQLQLGFLKVLKGTAIWQQADSYGIVYQENPPYEVLYTKWLSYGEILRLKQIEEMVELYFNSNQFWYTLPVLEKEFASPFVMFEELAEFYERKGYFVNSPARSYRYHVLLAFAEEKAPERKDLFAELLTFDYYLRENAKSRPDFAPDLSIWREPIWNFYQREEAAPKLLKAYADYHARQTMKMTHMEVFHYRVWGEDRNLKWVRQEEPFFVLFDYAKRDALTGAAVFHEVKPQAAEGLHMQDADVLCMQDAEGLYRERRT